MGLIIASVLVGATPVKAQANGSSEKEDNATHDLSPSIELLEFLGEWETDDGHWIDPTEFDPVPNNDSEMENETREND